VYPTVQIGSVAFPTYGLLAVLGALVMVVILVCFPYKKAPSREDPLYCLIFALVGAIVGAKLLFLISVAPQLFEFFKAEGISLQNLGVFFSGGIVFYGGLLGGILGVYVYARHYEVPRLRLFDSLAFAIPLFHVFGRLGCFFAGCCYGMHVDPPLGLYFPDSPYGVEGSVLPTQLIEAAFNLLLFAFLFIYMRKPRQDGLPTFLYLSIYALGRFVLEFFRGDEVRGIFGLFSTSQWISLAILAVSAWWFYRHVFTKRSAQEEGIDCC
jgi:phosphatidylglycerol:prolipoprotein diacylglycerol transferase